MVQSDQLLKQLGCVVFEPEENFRPIELHALVFWDEKHKEQVLVWYYVIVMIIITNIVIGSGIGVQIRI